MHATSLRAFLAAIVSSWFSGMSGPLSVPLTVAAVFVQNDTAKVLLALTAVICFWAAAYTVWVRERTARNQTEAAKDEVEAKVLSVGQADRGSDPVALAFRARKESQYRQILGVDIRADALRLTLENTDAFQYTKAKADHIIRIWRICVENIDVSHIIKNCKLHVEFNGDHALVHDIGTLNPTEKRFVDVGDHNETTVDPFVHIYAPRQGLLSESANYPELPIGNVVTFHATSADTRPTRLSCRLSLDTFGRLRMEKTRTFTDA